MFAEAVSQTANQERNYVTVCRIETYIVVWDGAALGMCRVTGPE
jgi:hypothetical protein